MKKPKKPKKCDSCFEEEELHWSKKYEEWICDLCERDLDEQEMIRLNEEDEAFEAMLDEEYNAFLESKEDEE